MKKQLNEIHMMSELRGQSIFFKGAQPQSQITQEETDQTVRPYDRNVRTDDTQEMSSRPTKRHPFEIYADQLKRLQTLKAKALMKGEALSMSEMVRDAIDRYLSEKE